MPRFADVETGREILAAGEAVLLRDGIPGLSLRAIAAEARVSPASLVHRYGGKERLLQVTCVYLSRGWNGYLNIRSTEGFAGLVPGEPEPDEAGWSDDGLRRLRGWLAVCELGRTREDISEVVHWHRERQVRLVEVLVAGLTGAQDWSEVCGDSVDRTFALLEGLWLARALTNTPMTGGRARALLDAHVSATFRAA